MTDVLQVQIDSAGYATEFLQKFNKLRQERRHCDFSVRVGEDVHEVHRCVLVISSEYFRVMLEEDTVENRRGYAEFNEMDPNAVRKAVEFMYTGKASVERDNVENLFKAAHLMQLHVLREGTGKLLADGLDAVGSFYAAKKFANTYNCSELADGCKRYAFKNFKTVIEHDEFTGLERDFIYSLVESSSTNAEEVVKYKAFLKWINFDVDSRRKHFSGMFLALNFADMPMAFRRHLVENQPKVREYPECLQYLLDSIFGKVKCKDVNTTSTNNAIACSSGNSVVAYDVKTESWEEICECEGSVVPVNNFIFLLRRDKKVFRRQYLSVAGDWVEIAPMKLDHGKHPPVVFLGGFIYAVGNAETGNCRTEKYYLATNEWTIVKTNGYLLSLSKFATCASLDSIFFVGGCTKELGTIIQRRCVQFHVADSSLCDIAPMSQARYSAAAAYRNGKLYVVGGSAGRKIFLNDAEVYDVNRNFWSTITNLPSALNPVGAVFVMDTLFVLGSSEIFEYDTEANSWKKKECKNGVPITPNAGCFPIAF